MLITEAIMDTQRRRDDHLHLPQEIIDEILLLLPVKSLLRFRCVSKSWRALISSRRFAKAHLEKSSNDPSLRHHSVIISNHRLQRLPLASLFSEPLTEAVYSDFLMYYGPFSKYMSSCNGLVCLRIRERDFVVWNPSTRTYKNLPPLLPWSKITAWGFGYMESGDDDYKVFALTQTRVTNGVVHYSAKVCSLKTGSWRTIDYDYQFTKLRYDEAATCLGGKLYWLKKFSSEKRLRWEIITFDLEKESGTNVEQPDTVTIGDVRSLGILDGHLCVLSESFEVWVWKKNGLNETLSWNKMMSLPNPGVALSYSSSIKLRVGDGAILGYDERNLAIYCPRARMFRKCNVLNLCMFTFVSVHVESLVSLGSDCEAEPWRSVI